MLFICFIKNIIGYIEYLVLKVILFNSKRKSENNILFINTGQIGDLIVSSIILENDQVFEGKGKIIFVVKDQYLQLLKNYNGKVEILGYNYSKYKFSLLYKYKFLINLRHIGFRRCYNLTTARGILNDQMALLSGAEEIYCLNSNWEYLTKFFGKRLDQKYSKIITKNYFNEYDKNIEVIKSINKKYTPVFNYNKVFPLIENNNDYDIAIVPFSSENNRDWEIQKFDKLITVLSQKYKIILLGSFVQRMKLYNLKNDNNNIIVKAGELNLNDLPNVIKNTKLFLGLDSGLTHIALKVETPLIAIIGGGNYGKFFPYKESGKVKYLYHKMDCFSCEWRCVHKEPYCLTEVSVDEVLENVNELIN